MIPFLIGFVIGSVAIMAGWCIGYNLGRKVEREKEVYAKLADEYYKEIARRGTRA